MITWCKVKEKLKLTKKDEKCIKLEKEKLEKEACMKDRWKTNLSWFKKHTFGFLIGFFWGFWAKQSKIAPRLAGKREDMIARIARGLADISHRPYDECYADIKWEWDNFDKNGLKDWMKGEK